MRSQYLALQYSASRGKKYQKLRDCDFKNAHTVFVMPKNFLFISNHDLEYPLTKIESHKTICDMQINFETELFNGINCAAKNISLSCSFVLRRNWTTEVSKGVEFPHKLFRDVVAPSAWGDCGWRDLSGMSDRESQCAAAATVTANLPRPLNNGVALQFADNWCLWRNRRICAASGSRARPQRLIPFTNYSYSYCHRLNSQTKSRKVIIAIVGQWPRDAEYRIW